MRTLRGLSLVGFATFCLVLPTWAVDEPKAAVKSGGNFEVEAIKDVAYYEGKDADANKHKLDLYLPKGQKDYPVLFFIHGGGWTKGDRKGFDKVGRVFAKNGVGFVAISYRLTEKHPAHIQDVAKAFAFTHKHIGKHGGNVQQIFVSGHSAGGHLAALLATDETYLKAEMLSFKDVKGVLPISGVFRISTRQKNVFSDDAEVCRKASPTAQVKENLPPFLVLYADKELNGLGKQADEFGAALKKAKVDATVVMIKDRDHGTIVRKMTDGEADPCAQAMLAFIAKHSTFKLTPKEPKKEGK
jgi:acetyl esterase/lipase